MPALSKDHMTVLLNIQYKASGITARAEIY